jgi:hypothetical protein
VVPRLPLVFVVLLVAVTTAGCGGGGDESSASGDTTVTETVMEDTITSDDSAGDADLSDLSGILADEDCLALAGVGATIAQAYTGGAASSGESTAELNALAARVPEEIKADVQAIAKWYADYSSKLEAIGIGEGETPSVAQLQQLQSALASFDQQELTDAAENISAWAEDNCSAAGG